jgi:4-carboxymuconolactone decarboxylase
MPEPFFVARNLLAVDSLIVVWNCRYHIGVTIYIGMLGPVSGLGWSHKALTKEKNKMESRREIGLKTLGDLTQSDGTGILTRLKDFPVLAEGVVDFAYGEVLSRDVLDPKVRQLATVSSLASQGMLKPQLKVHFAGALNIGVKPEELIEIVYITAIYAGMPKALNAAAILQEVFNEKDIKITVMDD